MYASFNQFEIKMTRSQAESASHPGQCDEDVAALVALPSIRRQLAKLTDAQLVSELTEYGAWDDDELKDRHENELRIIWLAAGNIVEGL